MTTRPGEVPARIQQYFLHEVKITPPSQEQRLKMLRQLLMTTPTSASELAFTCFKFIVTNVINY